MSGVSWLLVILGYVAMAHAVATPQSAWVTADREKTGWVVMLAIPLINVFGLIAYVVGVLPVLLGPHREALGHAYRRGGPGGPATRSRWAPADDAPVTHPHATPTAATVAAPPTPTSPATAPPVWTAAPDAGRTTPTPPPDPGRTALAPSPLPAAQPARPIPPASAVAPPVTAGVGPPPVVQPDRTVPAPATAHADVPVQHRQATPPVPPPRPVVPAPATIVPAPSPLPAPVLPPAPARPPVVPASAACAPAPAVRPASVPAPPQSVGPSTLVGAPAEPVARRGRSPVVPAIAIGLTLLVTTAAVLVVAMRPALFPTETSGSDGSVAAAATPVSSAPAPTKATTAGDLLRFEAEKDRPAVESTVGRWLPQISSKQPGLVADGITYDDDTILQNAVVAKQQYPQVELLRSDDYSTFKRSGFWVLVVAQPFSTAAEANAWCDANGLASSDCFAKRLSHTDGPEGNTVLR